MPQPNQNDEARSKGEPGNAGLGEAGIVSGALPSENQLVTAAQAAALPAEQLSAAEQMALYEKQLKEDDWGHQPC